MKKENFFLFLTFTVFFISKISLAQDDCPKYSRLAKQLSTPGAVKININNISTVIRNDDLDDQSLTGKSGFEFPRLSKKTTIYVSSLMWGGISTGSILVGGAYYNSGITPGKILQDGTAQNPNLLEVRIYRVRPDYKTSNFENEIADGEGSADQIKTKYEKDWNEWPANDGAPYKDVDKDGKYNPSFDIPGIPGADQTIWYVANDFDAAKSTKVSGCEPLGLELQLTVWAYNKPDAIGNTIFKKYRLINKKNTKIEDMYLALFVDPDVGEAGDDFTGCDTTLNLGYAYNGKDVDNVYGMTPPAVGFVIIQGPKVSGNSSDVAIFNQQKFIGSKNLGMNAFYYFTCGGTFFPCPGIGANISTYKWYNYFRGLHPTTNDYFSIPAEFGGGKTKYTLSGDPVAKTGWIDGIQLPPRDRYFGMSTGPFNMAAGDTQEVIIAEIAAGGDQGISRLAAVSLLKQTAVYAHIFYKNNYSSPFTAKAISNLQATEMDRQIILSWGDDINRINEIENSPPSIFSFQGYNVYQISKNEMTRGQIKRITTYDIIDGKQQIYGEKIDSALGLNNLVVKQYGTDSGIQRFIAIDKDYWYNVPLNNGTDYDFAVSYYQIRNDNNFIFSSYESPIATVSVKPQQSKPGIHYESKFGDIITTRHNSGSSVAKVTAMIVDPTKVTGDEYEVTFTKINNKTVFSLRNVTSDKYLLINQPNLTGDNDYIITDGFILKVKNDLNHLLTENDIYRFTSPAMMVNPDLTESEINRINVFPNPYYGDYRNEFSKYDKHVTFSHLPQRAVIRIFNLAGQLVRKLEKDSREQFLRWNLLTEEYFQVASGLYIVHIELPDFGKVKILKLAIISEVFIPDGF